MTKEAWLEEIEGGELEEDAWDVLKHGVRSLKWHGLYERYLVRAYREIDSCHDLPSGLLRELFAKANRKQLLEAGDSLPVDTDAITLYRGVSGKGEKRNVKGMSWTDEMNIACLFALRYSDMRFAKADGWAYDPAAYKVTVPRSNILCYMNAKGEREFLLDVTRLPKPERMEFKPMEMWIRSRTWC